jgi:hypothetical protein
MIMNVMQRLGPATVHCASAVALVKVGAHGTPQIPGRNNVLLYYGHQIRHVWKLMLQLIKTEPSKFLFHLETQQENKRLYSNL